MTHPVHITSGNKMNSGEFGVPINNNDVINGQNDIADSKNEVNNFEKEKKQDRIKKIATKAIILSMVAIASVAAYLGISNGSKNNKVIPNPNPSSDHSEDTNNSQEVITVIPTAENYELSAELTDEQLAQEIIDNLDTVVTMHMTQDTYNEYLSIINGETKYAGSFSLDTWVVEKVTPDIDEAFTKMFGADYASDPENKKFFDIIITLASRQLRYYIVTNYRNESIPHVSQGANMPVETFSLIYNGYEKNGNILIISETEQSNFWDTILGKESTSNPETNPGTVQNKFVFNVEKTQTNTIIDFVNIQK